MRIPLLPSSPGWCDSSARLYTAVPFRQLGRKLWLLTTRLCKASERHTFVEWGWKCNVNVCSFVHFICSFSRLLQPPSVQRVVADRERESSGFHPLAVSTAFCWDDSCKNRLDKKHYRQQKGLNPEKKSSWAGDSCSVFISYIFHSQSQLQGMDWRGQIKGGSWMTSLAPSSTSLDLYLSIHPLLMGNKDSACVMIQKCEPLSPESKRVTFLFFCFCKTIIFHSFSRRWRHQYFIETVFCLGTVWKVTLFSHKWYRKS